MKKYPAEVKVSEILIPLSDFLKSYNTNIPESFPRASVPLLKKFQAAHATLFKNNNLWSLDRHRKKLIDWLPRNGGIFNTVA
ncbi:MAG: hypothetical protein AAB587_01700 [Patescibacteria group bacterium]